MAAALVGQPVSRQPAATARCALVEKIAGDIELGARRRGQRPVDMPAAHP
jgi:hypothetical protein